MSGGPVNTPVTPLGLFSRAFAGKHEILEDKIEIDYGLLTKLRDYNVLNARQVEEIEVLQFSNFYHQKLHLQNSSS